MADPSIYMLLLVGYVGLFVHFLKKKIKGETVTEVISFFTDNPKQTLLSVISVAVAILVVENKTPIGYESAFGIGFMADSLLNKWEGNG